ncbi:MAG TPA: extracellular solute-binding protein [Firmicutes bacterium]|nr:extracellular solute-binding protein [Bacillota bacterium]
MAQKRWFVLLMVLVLTLGLTAAGTAAEKTKLTIWTYFNVQHNELLDEFYKEFPDVELEIMSVGGASTAEKYLVAYLGGAGPDIVTMRLGQSSKYIDAGVVAPLDPRGFGAASMEELERMMLPGALSLFRYKDGKVYFLPIEFSIFGFYYNKTLLDEAGIGGVPSTWEELLETGPKLLKIDPLDGKTIQVALYIWRDWFTPWQFHILTQGYGVTPFNDKMEPQFSHPNAVKAISIYPELFRRLSNNTDMGLNNTVWLRGAAAMHWGANYMAAEFKEANLMFEWGSAPMPKFAQGQPSTVAYAHGHFVNPQSKNKELAWKVVGFFSGPEKAEWWYRRSNLWQPWSGTWLARLFQIDPSQRAFLEQMSYAVPEINHPSIDNVQNLIRKAEDRIFRGQQSVEASLIQLDEELRALN